MPLKPLPIDAVIPDALQRLQDKGALVLIAAPGAGKTTRIPPAVLDAKLANLASGQPGQIVVLQPRRVAARSAAARISDERGTKLGQEIGYMVRHERLCSRDTRILVCTQGVFLRRLQDDPMLEQVSCVVFDEFHERTLDSDLALALVSQVRSALRPDLKIIVMSATLDATPVSKFSAIAPSSRAQDALILWQLSILPRPSKSASKNQSRKPSNKWPTKAPGMCLHFCQVSMKY
ncbi:MAG: DEAD/DEAH box helicase [Candidatus Obscuribacter sp.]|nr:DEAD/DEAH box helicase [Candidatus Obscuribacter sp.]